MTTKTLPTLTHTDFALRGASAVAAYIDQTFEVESQTLANAVAYVLGQPFRCYDCEGYQPLVVITTTGFACPNSTKGQGHRISNDVLQHVLDTSVNVLTRDLTAKG